MPEKQKIQPHPEMIFGMNLRRKRYLREILVWMLMEVGFTLMSKTMFLCCFNYAFFFP